MKWKKRLLCLEIIEFALIYAHPNGHTRARARTQDSHGNFFFFGILRNGVATLAAHLQSWPSLSPFAASELRN